MIAHTAEWHRHLRRAYALRDTEPQDTRNVELVGRTLPWHRGTAKHNNLEERLGVKCLTLPATRIAR